MGKNRTNPVHLKKTFVIWYCMMNYQHQNLKRRNKQFQLIETLKRMKNKKWMEKQMAVVIILFLIFVIMGIIFLFGKGSFLIAGYNTADKKEKEKYDEKKLNLCFACFSFGMAAVIGACGYMDTEAFAVQVGLPAIIALVIFVFIATNTFCKKK